MEYLLKKYKIVIKRSYSIFESLVVVFLMIIGAALAMESIFLTILVFFLVIIGLIVKNTILVIIKAGK